jgi:Kef-type K+ transport system membrane component KefB
MESALFGFVTVVALALALFFAAFAGAYVRRLEGRTFNPIGDEIGSARTVTVKVRKGEPLSPDELDYAKQIIGARSSVMAFCIPATLFMLGTFYVFGSLYHLHGATPSERTFLGVFPMLAATNFTAQILRSIRLKRRLRNIS